MDLTALQRAISDDLATVRLRIAPACLQQFPEAEQVAAAAAYDRYRNSEALPLPQQRLASRLADQFPDDLHNCHRLVLLGLMRRRLTSPEFDTLPTGVRSRTLEWLEQLSKQALEPPADRFDPNQPGDIERSSVRKAFAVAAGQALPVQGAWVVERSRMLRSRLFAPLQASAQPSTSDATVTPPQARRQRRSFRSRLRTSPLQTPVAAGRRRFDELRRRYSDYLVIHTAYPYRRQFSPRYMEAAYRDMADLLEAWPDVLGIYRRSWFLDPALATVEPRMAYLRELPVSHGASLHQLGVLSPTRRPEILEYSKRRRDAYERGDYTPSEWAYFWPRDAVLRWAGRRDP